MLLWLPEAIKDHVGTPGTWSEKTNPKGCLHTTETPSWPTYAGFTINPHATIMPVPKRGVVVRQHLPFSGSSFALRNLSGGVQTNRDYTFQFELVGTCDLKTARDTSYYYWPNADDAVLLDLFRKVIWPLSQAYDIPLVAPTWQGYPASYGARGVTNSVRMSGPTFDNYSGWLGHQHVPENVHGDPGAFPWARMMELAQPIINPPKENKLVSNTAYYGGTGVDYASASAVAALKPESVVISRLEVAKQYALDGGAVVLVGTQAMRDFGFTDPVGKTVHNNVVVCNGANRVESFNLAMGA